MMQFPGAAARPTMPGPTDGTSALLGFHAPAGTVAAAPVSLVEAEVSTLLGTPRRDDSPATAGASVSALPDDLDQVWQPLLWDRPRRRWHPVTTVNLKGTLL